MRDKGAERESLWMNRGHGGHVNTVRKICALLSVFIFAFLFAAIPVSAHNQAESANQAESTHQFTLEIYGNANEDDTIDMRDVTYIKLVIFGKKPETEFCDANYDGRVSMLDVVQTKLIIVGKEGELTIVDSANRTVTIHKPVKRVVGVEAGALRLIVYLRATDRVVGVEDVEKQYPGARPYIIAHPELAELPSIGPIHGGDDELILAQHPDVIFWTYTTAEKADERQEKTGIPVIALGYGDLAPEEDRKEYYSTLLLMSYVLDEEERAKELIDYTEELIQDLEERTSDVPEEDKPKVYVGGIGYRGAHGILSTKPFYPPFVFVNAENVAGELGVSHAFIDKEQLIEWNPDIIFVDEGGISLVMEDLSDPVYQSISAVKNGELYGILPYNWYTHNYATTLADAYYIGKVLYPERFVDVDPVKKAEEIYEMHVGAPVYEQMASEFGGFKKIELEA